MASMAVVKSTGWPTGKAVHERPYQAIGIAFGVGLLIGVVAMRCRCKRD